MASSHGRGSNSRAFRGRGFSNPSQSGRGTFQREQRVQNTTIAGPPPPPLGPHLSDIRIEDIEDDGATSQHRHVGIERCQYVASYNWLEAKSPTILVPGE